MDITRRCDYACRILRAAYRNGTSYRSVSDIADEEGVPYAFARSIQHDLVKGGLVKTVRGARGGMVLACDPEKVTLLELLEAIQGPVSVASCTVEDDSCEHQDGCAFNKVWLGADSLLQAYFGSITLAALLQQGEDHPVVKQAVAQKASMVARKARSAPDTARMAVSACSCEVPHVSASSGHCARCGGRRHA